MLRLRPASCICLCRPISGGPSSSSVSDPESTPGERKPEVASPGSIFSGNRSARSCRTAAATAPWSPDHPHWRHQRSVFSPSSPGESAANSWTSDTRDAGSVWPKALRHWSWEVDAGTSPPRPSHHTQRRDHNPDDRQAAAAKATTNSAVTCQ